MEKQLCQTFESGYTEQEKVDPDRLPFLKSNEQIKCRSRQRSRQSGRYPLFRNEEQYRQVTPAMKLSPYLQKIQFASIAAKR